MVTELPLAPDREALGGHAGYRRSSWQWLSIRVRAAQEIASPELSSS